MLGRDLVMVPKLIHPLPPSTPRTPHSPKSGVDIDEEPPTPHPLTDTWMQVSVAASHAATAAAVCTEAPVGALLLSDSMRVRRTRTALQSCLRGQPRHSIQLPANAA